MSRHSVNYTRMEQAVKLLTKLQHTGTRSVAARPPRRLCYRPAVFFLQLRRIVL
jgi:hypothetical protein